MEQHANVVLTMTNPESSSAQQAEEQNHHDQQKQQQQEQQHLSALPSKTLCVLVLRNYVERVLDWMQGRPTEWTPTSKKRPRESDTGNDTTFSHRMLPSTEMRGSRKARRGYAVLILETKADDFSRSMADLSPFARQNISNAMPLTHIIIDSGRQEEHQQHQHQQDSGFMKLDHSVLLSFLLESSNAFDLTNSWLRVETFPREKDEDVCLALQAAARKRFNYQLPDSDKATKDGSISAKDDAPYIELWDGPLQMTKSASRSTHTLFVVHDTTRHNQSNTNHDDDTPSPSTSSSSSCCWLVGVHKGDRVPLNHVAAEEILVGPTDSVTGKDIESTSNTKTKSKPSSTLSPAAVVVPSAQIPVSRAYYKLLQVYHEYWQDDAVFSRSNRESCLDDKQLVGIDLGSAPGGWTQVLCHKVGCTHVWSVDPATLADRVVSDPRVVHLRHELAAPAVVEALQQQQQQCDIPTVDNHDKTTTTSTTPPSSLSSSLSSPQQRHSRRYNGISLLVCDASTDSAEIMGRILELATKTGRGCFALPAVWVITLKMPYKTAGSVEANLQKAAAHIQQDLEKAVTLLYDESHQVRVQYKIVHLFANSDSERTILARFEKGI